MSSLGVYGIIMAGWASNSKYPFLSALRAAAQMVCYEVSIGFVIITVLLFAGSLNLSDIVRAQQARPFVPAFERVLDRCSRCCVIFFVSALAETNRPPFDLPEAESELVAGYQVEYSSTPFLLFYLGEYPQHRADVRDDVDPVLRRLAAADRCVAAQRGPGRDLVRCIKIWFFFFMFAMVKAIVPRYRYDQLMRLGWKVFLPTSLSWVVLTAGWVVFVRARRCVMASLDRTARADLLLGVRHQLLRWRCAISSRRRRR